MINLKENLVNFFTLNKIEDLSISGFDAMTKMGLEIDNLYDYASDKFYTLDTFILELNPKDLDKIKDQLIIDEAMWFKESKDDDEPLHETAGLKPLFNDCKVVILSSGLSLQEECFSFVDLYAMIEKAASDTKIILSVPLLTDDYYEVRFNKGSVTTSKNNLHRIRPDDLRLLAYQVMVLAADKKICDVIEKLNF